MPADSWTETLFDETYVQVEGLQFSERITARECDLTVKLLGLQPGQRVLDLACGHGRHAIELTKRGLGPVVGLDYSQGALEYARMDAGRKGMAVEFIEGDMRTLNFRAEFDAIFNVFSSMFYWDDTVHLEILRGVWHSLKPGGRFLLDVYNRDAKVSERFLDAHRMIGPLRRLRRGLSWLKRRVLHRLRTPNQPFVHKFNQSTFDFERGVMVGVKHILVEGQAPIENRFEVRLHTLGELRELLERAGFEIERMVSSPDGGGLRLSSPRWAVMARRPT